MKTLFSTTAVALLLAAPAFASPLVGNDSHDTNYSQALAEQLNFGCK